MFSCDGYINFQKQMVRNIKFILLLAYIHYNINKLNVNKKATIIKNQFVWLIPQRNYQILKDIEYLCPLAIFQSMF